MYEKQEIISSIFSTLSMKKKKRNFSGASSHILGTIPTQLGNLTNLQYL